MRAPPGRTLSQNDWPKTTRKLIPSPWNLGLSHVAKQFSWFPLPCCSPPGCLLPIKSLALSAHVSSDNSFLSVRQEPILGALEGGPPSYNTGTLILDSSFQMVSNKCLLFISHLGYGTCYRILNGLRQMVRWSRISPSQYFKKKQRKERDIYLKF